MVNTAYLKYLSRHYLRNLVNNSSAYTWNQEESFEIFPAETITYQGAIYLDNQIEKIRGTAFLSKEKCFESIKAGGKETLAVNGVRLKNAFITKKYLFTKNSRYLFDIRDRELYYRGAFEEVEALAMPSSYVGTNYFGHWLRDDCATHLLATDYAPVRCMETPDWPDRKFYERIFGLEWPLATGKFVKELYVFSDIGQNRHKALRFKRLRDTARENLQLDQQSDCYDMAYIVRGETGNKRLLTNEEDVIREMQSRGAYIHYPDSKLEDLYQKCLNVRIIAGIEGSQFSHALYLLRDRGGILAIQPPDRFFVSHADWCELMSMRFSFVVGNSNEDGFSVDLQEFNKTLDLLEQAVQSQ